MTEVLPWLTAGSYVVGSLALLVAWFGPSHQLKISRRDEALERIERFASLCTEWQPGDGFSGMSTELRSALSGIGPIRFSDAHLLRRGLVEKVDKLHMATQGAMIASMAHPGARMRYLWLFADVPSSVLDEVAKEEHTTLPLIRLMKGRKIANRRRDKVRKKVRTLLSNSRSEGKWIDYFADNVGLDWDRWKKVGEYFDITHGALRSVYQAAKKEQEGTESL